VSPGFDWFEATGMKASTLYRIAAVLLLLFAAGHVFGFTQYPHFRVQAVLAAMHAIHFDVGGFGRSYWDLFMAAGLIVGLFYVFAAFLAWELGGLPADVLGRLRVTRWAFAGVFAAITAVSAEFLFWMPILFSGAVTLCLAAAAWRGAASV
jgi:hypothetical protein